MVLTPSYLVTLIICAFERSPSRFKHTYGAVRLNMSIGLAYIYHFKHARLDLVLHSQLHETYRRKKSFLSLASQGETPLDTAISKGNL